MFKSHKLKLMAVLLALTAFAFIGLVGCSEMPTKPDEPNNTVLLKRNVAAYKVLGDADYFETVVSAEEGGVVSLHDVTINFPPRALSSDTLISIDIPDLSVFANNFGTDGLVFNVPVRVVMSYRDADLSGVNETSIKMAWYNDATEGWDIIDCFLDLDNKTVTADVMHFSAYALITDQ